MGEQRLNRGSCLQPKGRAVLSFRNACRNRNLQPPPVPAQSQSLQALTDVQHQHRRMLHELVLIVGMSLLFQGSCVAPILMSARSFLSRHAAAVSRASLSYPRCSSCSRCAASQPRPLSISGALAPSCPCASLLSLIPHGPALCGSGPPGDWRPVPAPRDSESGVPLKIY